MTSGERLLPSTLNVSKQKLFFVKYLSHGVIFVSIIFCMAHSIPVGLFEKFQKCRLSSSIKFIDLVLICIIGQTSVYEHEFICTSSCVSTVS